jgi:starch phosphorylase
VKRLKRPLSPTSTFFPEDVEGFDKLAELALDMHWSWNHSADEIWSRLAPDLWEMTANPRVVLQTVSRRRLLRVLADPGFHRKLTGLLRSRRRELNAPAWFQRTHSRSPLTCVAYFSMEFMLSEALPIYSGGLGNVAGDQLKTAAELGLPVVGVGLLYQQGYFRQVISKDGAQQAFFPYNDPGQLPVTPVREASGEWLRLDLSLPGYSIWLRVWQVQVGRVRLYLLDSNDPANFPARRGITSELYGGDAELRLNQELILGIGGWRLLAALGLRPEVCHLNEGHAAFAALDRARSFMEETGRPFDVALTATRTGNLFTTHTPVAVGFDLFPPTLLEQYLGRYAREVLGIPTRDLLALGRLNPDDREEPFNMAYLAIRGSGAVNGVSRLHGQVSRRIFQPLFPRWPESEVPVGHVTNGVHMPSWDSPEADELWTRRCTKRRWLEQTEGLEALMTGVSGDELWRLRAACRASLVSYVRERLVRQTEMAGGSPDAVERAKSIFNPDALTLGFARRFAAYKRPNLLLHDRARLARILGDAERPVQLIIAGKAHPADLEGQSMIREWSNFIRTSRVENHVVFLSDYDMLLTGRLVQGVDVWINTPRRPWEACGTSGMKVLVNGGLNLSELDGWWAEAYEPDLGWALGDGAEHGQDPAWDAAEAEALYTLLEREVLPEFYDRDPAGIPQAWVARIRNSMARLTPRFSANRTVRQYLEEYYLPASASFKQRAEQNGKLAVAITDRRLALDQGWVNVRIGGVRVEAKNDKHLFEARLHLGTLNPEWVRVELYADGIQGGEPVRQPMKRGGRLEAENGFIYSGGVPATRPASDYTVRVIPRLPGARVPLEAGHILWQR